MSDTEASQSLSDAERQVAGERQDETKETIDFTRYRTRDLVENVVSLISVPGAILSVFFTMGVVSIVALVAVFLLFYSVYVSKLGFLGSCAFALMASLPLGLILGVLRVVYRSLGNIEEILLIVLETADHVSEDASSLKSGTASMPPASELVMRTYDGVVAPAIEEAIGKVFWVFGPPINFFYQRTMGAAVRYMVKRTKTAGLDEQKEQEIKKEFENKLIEAAEYSGSVKDYTSSASKTVGKIGNGIRWYVMAPLFVFYCVLLALAALPLLIYRFWFGEPVLDVVSMVSQAELLLITAR